MKVTCSAICELVIGGRHLLGRALRLTPAVPKRELDVVPCLSLSALSTKCTPKRISFPGRVPQFSLPLKLHTASPQSISQTGTRNHTDQRCRTRGSGPVSPQTPRWPPLFKSRLRGLQSATLTTLSTPSPAAPIRHCRPPLSTTLGHPAVHSSLPFSLLLLPLFLPLLLPLFPIPYLTPLTWHNGRCQSEAQTLSRLQVTRCARNMHRHMFHTSTHVPYSS